MNKNENITWLCFLLCVTFSISIQAQSPETIQQEMDRSLIRAAQSGNLEEVKKYLAAVANPNATNEHDNNNSALHYAAMGGYNDVVQELLQHGADPTALNAFDQTPRAVAYSQHTLRILLLGHGFRSPYTQTTEETMQKQLNERLISAIMHRDQDAFSRALRDGADPNATNDNILPLRLSDGTIIMIEQSFGWMVGMPALFLSISNNPSSFVEDLLLAKADIHAVYRPTPTQRLNVLSPEISVHDPQTRSLLRMHGARELPNTPPERSLAEKQMDSNLLVASAHGDMQKVLELLEAGANPNAADHNNTTALHWGASSGSVDVVRVLIAYGADSMAITVFAETVYDWAANADIQNVLGIRGSYAIGLTLNSYPDVYTYTTRDQSQNRQAQLDEQLRQAILETTEHIYSKEALEAIDQALAEGANVNAIYKQVQINRHPGSSQREVIIFTPLHLAIQNTNFAVVRRLLSRGASLTFPYRRFILYQGNGNDQEYATHFGNDSTHYEGMHTHYEVIAEASAVNLAIQLENNSAHQLLEVFREYQVLDVNLPLNQNGQTLLHQAAATNDASTVSHLLDLGANPNIRDHQNRLPSQATTSFAIENMILSHKNFKATESSLEELYSLYGQSQKFFFAVIKYGSIDAVTRVLTSMRANGVNLNIVDENGRNFLHWAAMRGSPDIVRLLLNAGVAYTAFDRSGKQPIDLAKDEAITSLIRQKSDEDIEVQQSRIKRCLQNLNKSTNTK